MRHTIKTWSEHFQATKSYAKNFEVIKDQANLRVGDLLILKEQDGDTGELTGDELRKEVTYILRDSQFCKEGMALVGIKDLEVGKSYSPIGFRR